MGLLSGLRDTYKKSEAAVVVQNLLAHQAQAGLLELDSGKLANRLVSLVWDQSPDVYSGKFGQRPHKISVAASALAHGISLFADSGDDAGNRAAIVLSLGNVLSEIQVNGRLYPLNTLDHMLIEQAVVVFAQIAEQDDLAPAKKTVHHYESYETWYIAFKHAAGEVDPGLKPDEDSRSLIDFMDDEPLRRAFRDRVDPVPLAHQFAKQFDVTSFGMPPRSK